MGGEVRLTWEVLTKTYIGGVRGRQDLPGKFLHSVREAETYLGSSYQDLYWGCGEEVRLTWEVLTQDLYGGGPFGVPNLLVAFFQCVCLQPLPR